MTSLLERLAAPFDPDQVEWRVGSTNKRNFDAGKAKERKGLPLAYLDARDVMDRLDEVCGAQWQAEYIPMPNGTCCCRLGVMIEGDWIWRSNGAGATATEGDKGQYSDAFKRAAVLFGIGRYLYAIRAPWIVLDEYWGIPKEAHQQLRAALIRGSEPVRSAYDVRKSGDWDKAMRALQAAIPLGRLAVSDAVRELEPMTSKWPEEWRDKFYDAVGRAQDKAVEPA